MADHALLSVSPFDRPEIAIGLVIAGLILLIVATAVQWILFWRGRRSQQVQQQAAIAQEQAATEAERQRDHLRSLVGEEWTARRRKGRS